jgi:hypothetical protein
LNYRRREELKLDDEREDDDPEKSALGLSPDVVRTGAALAVLVNEMPDDVPPVGALWTLGVNSAVG